MDMVESSSIKQLEASIEELEGFEKELRNIKQLGSRIKEEVNLPCCSNGRSSPAFFIPEEIAESDPSSAKIGNSEKSETTEEHTKQFPGCGAVARVSIFCDSCAGFAEGACNPRRRFFGFTDISKHGKNTVLIYRIPEQNLCYGFHYLKSLKAAKVYRCTGCYKANRKNTMIKVIGNVEFEVDPSSLAHVCLPTPWTKEKSKRKLYEKYQALRNGDPNPEMTPYAEYLDLLMEVKRDEDLSELEGRGILMHLNDYKKRRCVFSRNKHIRKDSNATTVHEPDKLALNPEQFVESEATSHQGLGEERQWQGQRY